MTGRDACSGTGADWNNLPPSVAPTAAYGWPEGVRE